MDSGSSNGQGDAASVGKYSALRAAAAARQRQRNNAVVIGSSGSSTSDANGGSNAGAMRNGDGTSSRPAHESARPRLQLQNQQSRQSADTIVGGNSSIAGRDRNYSKSSQPAVLPPAVSLPPKSLSRQKQQQQQLVPNSSNDEGFDDNNNSNNLATSPSFSYEEVGTSPRNYNIVGGDNYPSSPKRGNNNNNDDIHYHVGTVGTTTPKTPLSIMRSVMSNIHKDRNEINGVLLETTTASGSAAVGKERGRGDRVSRGGREGQRLRGRSNNQDRLPADSYSNNNDDDDDDDDDDDENAIDDDDYFENNDLYQERCCDGTNPTQEAASLSYTSPNCIPYGSEIVLRFRNPHILTSISVHPQPSTPPPLSSMDEGGVGGWNNSRITTNERTCFVANESHAYLGGSIDRMGYNRFIIVKSSVNNSAVSSSDDGNNNVNSSVDGSSSSSDNVLCYGDKITLRSCALRRVLGVQQQKRESIVIMEGQVGDEGDGGQQQQLLLEVGCFRREGRFPTANTWTVIRGGCNANVVRLGMSSALPSSSGASATVRIPVHSGDPIALLNDWTGGLLSLGDECQQQYLSSAILEDINYPRSTYEYDSVMIPGWSLNIITSSYQLNPDGTASTHDDRPLIECLHRHDQSRPRKTETFQIFMANIPHCPNWAYPTCERRYDRIYLNGSYLSHLDRHGDGMSNEEGKLVMEMFPQCNDVEHQGRQQQQQGERKRVLARNVSSSNIADLSVDMQEKVLLDEILGAMMGHEGRFVNYRMPVNNYDEVEDDMEMEHDMSPLPPKQPQFVLAPSVILGGSIDASIESILSELLPLCTDYVYVNQYVQTCLNQYEFGVIARTLCEAMNEFLKEYLSFVTNLDYLSREVENLPSSMGTGAAGGTTTHPMSKQWLTVSRVYVESRPAIRTMSILSRVVSNVRGKKGGELLNALHRLMSLNYSGDEKGRALIQHFLTKCAVPYAKMLQTWLTRGKVHDPYGEFMIEVTSKPFRENCVTSSIVKLQGLEWADWCCEKEEHLLFSLLNANEDILYLSMTGNNAGLGVDRSRATLHMSSIHKAHATGKLCWAIHCCNEGGDGSASSSILATTPKGQGEEKKCIEGVEHAMVLLNPLKLSRSIDQAYHEASDTFLRMQLHKYDLLSSLRFMKKYFLLDQGDFFVHFLDHAEDELQNPLPSVLQGRVQNWLSASIARTSDSPQLSSNLRCSFQNKSLKDTIDDMSQRKSSKKIARPKSLMGFEAITFEFKHVPFPTSIVLSTRQLRIYQLIFRLIFFAKYAERQLVNMWSDHQLLKTMTSLGSACSPTFSLRRRMLHFIQNLVYYLKFDVIEPNWRELESKLNSTKEYCSSSSSDRTKCDYRSVESFPRTVDDLVHEHDQFLIRTAQQCLITNYDLIDRASKIMTTCLLFSTQIKRFMETTKVHDLHERTRQERSQLRYAKKRNKDDSQETTFRINRQERTQRCSDGIYQELCSETYRHMITRFDEVFSAHLSEFMKNLNSDFGQKSNAHLANLSMQLDYNGFLSSSIYEKEQN